MKRSIWNWLFVVSTLGMGLLFSALVFEEAFPEWKKYQSEYYKRLARVTGEKERARTPVKLLQIYLPEMNRTDRCITCHTGIDNPKMTGQPQPFAAHPGGKEFLAAHPFNEMGCTVCHHGQGSATTKKHAHGPVKHWEEPLLAKELTAGTCTACHGDARNLPGAEALARAAKLFDDIGCIGCHTLHGKGMLIGPELDETFQKGVDQYDFRYVKGDHTVSNWVIEHFRDPQAVVPGDPHQGIPETAMPKYYLTEEEIQQLTALTLSFSSEKGSELHPIPHKFKVPAEARPQPKTNFASPIEKGKAAFQKYGCHACHGIGARGGIRNKNMYPGEEVPPLVYVAGGFSKDEVKQVIRDGRYPARADSSGPVPPLWMPSWAGKIPEDEIDAIADYILSLYPDARQ